MSRPISAAKIKRTLLYVPPSMPATNLLIRMQTSRIHMALVVDEYGGTDGLVTIEDLVEQIVGDIEDEHDEARGCHDHDRCAQRHRCLWRARQFRSWKSMLGVTLLTPDEEEDIDTIGGLVFAIVGRVPARGELVRHASGVEFEVLDADPRRVKKLKIHKSDQRPRRWLLKPRSCHHNPKAHEARVITTPGTQTWLPAVMARIVDFRSFVQASSGWTRAAIAVAGRCCISAGTGAILYVAGDVCDVAGSGLVDR